MEFNSEISKKITTLAQKGARFLFLIDFDGNGEVYTPEEAKNEGISFEFTENYAIEEGKVIMTLENDHNFTVHPVSYDSYLVAFNKAQHAYKGATPILLISLLPLLLKPVFP